jgi:hypothetical protein
MPEKSCTKQRAGHSDYLPDLNFKKGAGARPQKTVL